MIFIGSTLGAWIPSFWHAGLFSVWVIIFSVLGAVAGIFAAAWISNNFLEV